MNKISAIELLRSTWLIHTESVDLYRLLVIELLAGKEVSTGLFSKIALPAVPDSMALIPMAGVLAKADVCGGMGTRSLTSMIMTAADDPAIKSILLYAENCPGGQVDGTQVMADAVRYAKKKKPVMGAISGMNCSAGEWIMSQANEMYATSGTDIIGCIGVVARIYNPAKSNDPSADVISVYSDLSPDKNIESKDAEALKKAYLNPVAELFHSAMKEGRGDRLKLEKENVLSGKTYVAADAKKYGLIDGIMPISKIIARASFLGRTFKQ